MLIFFSYISFRNITDETKDDIWNNHSNSISWVMTYNIQYNLISEACSIKKT